MKQKLITLAVAAAITSPAAVLADVNISGQLQTQLVNITTKTSGNGKGIYMTDGGTVGNVNHGGSWGALSINASEDLGGGLKALASYGFNISTQDGDSFDKGITTRQAYVGIAGDFGAVLAGRMNHPYKTATIGWDPFVGTFMQARLNGGMGGTAAGDLYGPESSNALAYVGSFEGVRFAVAGIVDEAASANDPEKTEGKHAYAFSVNMPLGPVEVALAHANMSKMAGGADKASASKVGVKYSAGDFTVAGQYEMLDEGMGADKGNVAYVTGSYSMGANTVSLSYGQEDKKLRGSDDNTTYMAVGVSHAFSQKTNVFAGYRASTVGAADGADKNKHNAVGAGMRVRF